MPAAKRRYGAFVYAWNWKAAAFSAVLRAAIFLATNLSAGGRRALRATLAEAAFAIAAAGLMGACTQRLRNARPIWAMALIVYLGLPALMLAAQFGWHRALGTPHLRTGLIVSFCFASLSTGFNWFAMRRGALLAGAETSSLARDLRAIPGLVLDFVLFVPRAVLRRRP